MGVSSRRPPPTWKTENEHGWHVVHCASAAAILTGWYLASTTPNSLPTNSASASVGITTTSDSVAERLNADTSIPLRRYHADTASITMHPVTTEARITCT